MKKYMVQITCVSDGAQFIVPILFDSEKDRHWACVDLAQIVHDQHAADELKFFRDVEGGVMLIPNTIRAMRYATVETGSPIATPQDRPGFKFEHLK